MLLLDRFNVQKDLGKEHLISLRINCVLRKVSENVLAEECLTV
jgi:hypothetical protein